MLKAIPLSIPFSLRYIIISSLQHIAVLNVQSLFLINSWTFPCHTSVPCASPAILIRSATVLGFASIHIFIAKSVPNSGIVRHPSFVPLISLGLM